MNNIEKEIINIIVHLHGKRAVSSLMFTDEEAIAALRSDSRTKDSDFDPEAAAALISRHPGLYNKYAVKIANYIAVNFPCTATSRCFPGDLHSRRQDIYRFIDCSRNQVA